MNVKRLIQSFKDAGRGVSFVYKNEQNFRIQLFFALVVIVSMFALGVRTSERIVILLLIILVVVLEFINTIIEKFLDLLKPRLHGSSGPDIFYRISCYRIYYLYALHS